MSDLISRADAIEAVCNKCPISFKDKCEWKDNGHCSMKVALEALPSAKAEPIVIRAKTFMRKEDFDRLAEDIKRQGENIICIPCDAEVVSAEAVTHGRLIDADALSEKLCETTIFIKDGEVFQRMINDAPTVSAEAASREEYEETDGVIKIKKQSAKHVGEIKHIVVCSPNYTRYFYNDSMPTQYIWEEAETSETNLHRRPDHWCQRIR